MREADLDVSVVSIFHIEERETKHTPLLNQLLENE